MWYEKIRSTSETLALEWGLTGQPDKDMIIRNGGNGTYDPDFEGPTQFRGGALYGGIIYRGNAYFVGVNNEKVLHTVQNGIHNALTLLTKGEQRPSYFADMNNCSKTWSYFGNYGVNSLVY